ncbi:DUF6538 domain-containing protein [Ancylobacter terrae]|uniref:DUF6538 domain-containing protein n=1 Tax=Ancylobacter sp. sgz301288 TaxID=3342077 RepID=UPI00385D658C
MRYDKMHLEQHRRQWRVRIAVPKDLRETIGKPHMVVSLGTESLSEAARLKHAVIARIRQTFEETRKGKAKSGGTLMDEAIRWKTSEVVWDGPEEEVEALKRELIYDRAELIEETHGKAAAAEFGAVATGSATPFLPLVDKWLDERISMKPRQKHDYRRAITKFAAYCPTIEGATRRKVGQYVAEHFVEKGIHPRTINKDVSCLSSFWRWLERRGYVEGDNPWRGQGVNDRDLEAATISKRPFTNDEVFTLVAGSEPGTMLGDAVRIAALSGMRVSEIAKLRVKDTADGLFHVLDAKTKAGNRVVPVHPALTSIVATRTAGKEPEERLFSELPVIKEGSAIEPGQAITKHFGRLRTKLKVDEKVAGARQSNIDFHSFRRWFVTKAEMAGQPPHIISSVVGHARQGMTLGTYSGGPSVEQLRACVEAVTLPKEKEKKGGSPGT